MIDHEVCYGALHDAMAKALDRSRISQCLSADTNVAQFVYLNLRQKDHLYVLCSVDSADFAYLDTRTVSKLNTLRGVPTVRFEAVIQSSVFTKRQRGSKLGPQLFPVSINIFGSKSAADDAASRLSNCSICLQHPKSLYAEVEYHNPQFLTFDDDENLNMSGFIGMENDSPWALKINISEVIGSILESLTEVATEEILELPTALTSTLKKHQEDGLRFILQREDEESSRQLSARLRQVINIETKEPPSAPLGGLIADVMGLGKTLTILAAILHSMRTAELFSDFYNRPEDEYIQKVRTKATLVVVSSTQLLESWVSEIQDHFCPGALSFIRFHGNNRPQNLEALRSVNLVLTTYATLAADQAGRCILHQMEWYRVALDEAHLIRNSSSKRFRAASSLYTRRRWCLTGTPIQNKLEDLTSLTVFLQLPPLSTKVAFQKHILLPLSGGGPDFAKPLRTYLEAYCLRRSETCVTLPPSKQENVVLRFSSEEQRLYDLLVNETRHQIDSLVSKGDSIRCNILFTAMLRMRMLCNLGTFSPVKTKTGSVDLPHLEVGCERCSGIDDDSLMLLSSYSLCPDCGKPLRLSSPLPGSVNFQRSDAGNSRYDGNIVTEKTTQVLAAQTNPVLAGCFSTKLSSVVQNVRCSGPEAKSIIFSYWTSTLDILSQLFRQANISFLQIDGRVSYTERSKSLKAFKEDPQVLVLLMSIETGAVGLNLAVANRVHIVEPQWNPSVEEQAIARAVRMGQTREVTIVRYTMEKTVEQNIVNLQQKKKRLAKFTFDTETGETLSGAIEDLKSVLDIGLK
ncbi:SNF2 family N-terminal domain-containing protein [Annulohypoxylon bovei var. microspora]|nr:SNF2 family N-terminal domain-containing protein [Annulohypoxylon bovei var. microspora]